MYFETVNDLLAMGGHALYVWLAYGVALAGIIWLLARPLMEQQQILREVRTRVRKQDTRATSEKENA